MATTNQIERLRRDIGVPADRPSLLPDNVAASLIDAPGDAGFTYAVLARACRYVANAGATSRLHDAMVERFFMDADFYNHRNADEKTAGTPVRYDADDPSPTVDPSQFRTAAAQDTIDDAQDAATQAVATDLADHEASTHNTDTQARATAQAAGQAAAAAAREITAHEAQTHNTDAEARREAAETARKLSAYETSNDAALAAHENSTHNHDAQAREAASTVAHNLADHEGEVHLSQTERDKLAGIEDDATADQTGAEIVAAIDRQLGGSGWQTEAGEDVGLDQDEVDARIAPYARATPSGKMAIEQAPDGLATDSELTEGLSGKSDTDHGHADLATDTALNAHEARVHMSTLERQKLARYPSDPSALRPGLADGSVTNDKLADNAVNHRVMADDSVGPRELQADSVREAHISDGAVTAGKIPNDTISERHIAADSVGQSELKADAVGTVEIVDRAVTEDKLSADVQTKLNATSGTGPGPAPSGGLTEVAVGDGLSGDGTSGDPIEILYEDRDFGIRNVRNVRGEDEARLGLSNAVRAVLSRVITEAERMKLAGLPADAEANVGEIFTAAEKAKLGIYPTMGTASDDGRIVAWSQNRGRYVLANAPSATGLEAHLLPQKSSGSTQNGRTTTISWSLAEIRTVDATFAPPTGEFLLSAQLSDHDRFSVERVTWDATNQQVNVELRLMRGNNQSFTGRVTLFVLRGVHTVTTAGITTSDVNARIIAEVAPWAIQGNADGIPGSKTVDGIFRASGDEDVPGAATTINFNVPANVEDTEASGTSFVITAQQANQPGAFLTAKYDLRTTSTGDLPTDLELLLQVRDTGAIIGRHNLKIIATGEEDGHIQVPVGDAGAKRWAIRVGDGHGGYQGSLVVSEVRYHTAVPLADDFVKRIIAPEIHDEKEERQRVEAQLQEEIDEAKAIVAITDALPAPANVVTKRNIVWDTTQPWRQADSDSFDVPATGYVQFGLGSIGRTPMMHVAQMNSHIQYAVGTLEIGIQYNPTTRKVSAYARDGQTRWQDAQDLVGGSGLFMNHWNQARRGGTDTGSPSWERVLGLTETLPNSRDPAVRRDIGSFMLPRAEYPQIWEIAGIAEVQQDDEDDDIRRFNCRLSFTPSGAAAVHRNATGDVIGNGLGEEHLIDHFYSPGPGGDDDVWRVAEWDHDNIRSISVGSGVGAVQVYVYGNLTGKVRNLRIWTKVIA